MLATAGIVLFGGNAGPAGHSLAEAVVPVVRATVPSQSVTVHVAGAVVAPGLVELAEGSRVADAVVAAGGSIPRADLSALNLVSAVRDGDRIVVPAMGDDPRPQPSAAAGDGRVRVNAATASELEALPGVGPVLASRIVEHREAHGAFREVEDLLDVAGIGEAKLASMRDSLVVP